MQGLRFRFSGSDNCWLSLSPLVTLSPCHLVIFRGGRDAAISGALRSRRAPAPQDFCH